MSTEEQVRRAAEVKLWLESRIAELEEETQRLREALTFVDTTLRASTYRPAIEMLEPGGEEIAETREIKRDKGGGVLAKAVVTSGSIVVEPSEGVTLHVETPPFRSFLVNKILEGMRTKDEDLTSKGQLPRGQALRYNVEERGGILARLSIENYRERSRMNEVLNTIAWTFSRMLEK